MMTYTAHFSDPHPLTEGESTTLEISGYDDLGSMYTLELTDGSRRSVGKQLVEAISESGA